MHFKKILILSGILLLTFRLIPLKNLHKVPKPFISSYSENIILEENVTKKESKIQPDIINKEESTMSQPNTLNRVTYQPDFYYEDISNDIKKKTYRLSYKEDATIPYEDLRFVSILHIDFENKTQVGELICNKEIASDLVEIFCKLYEAQYPIEQIRLIDEYNADDLLSMADNNTSCFNYRVVEDTATLSKHALGMAIDINPFFNPYVSMKKEGLFVSPAESTYYADRSKDFAYKIDEDDLCYQLFQEHGFTWGGSFKTIKDYQHFQKNIKNNK